MEAFIGQIMLVPYTFAPRGWADCSGQLMSINQNTALFSLLGTSFGGDGRSNFALPNLQSRAAVGLGQGPGRTGYQMGQTGGAEWVTLDQTMLAAHVHGMAGTGTLANAPAAVGNSLATQAGGRGGGGALYASPPGDTAMAAVMGQTGGNQPHPNLQPYLAMRYVICIQGIYPSRP